MSETALNPSCDGCGKPFVAGQTCLKVPYGFYHVGCQPYENHAVGLAPFHDYKARLPSKGYRPQQVRK